MASFLRSHRVSILLFVLAGVVFFWIYQKNVFAAGSPTVTTGTVTKGDFTRTIESSGKTQADREVELKFQASGRLTWVGVKEGDQISAGHTIATLDSREVQKTLQKSLRDYSIERNDFEETKQVTYGNKQPTDGNDTLKRILEKNQWDLEKAVLDVQLKSLALEYANLVSPIDGIVTHIDTPVAGVNITPAGAVFTITDPTSLIFSANIDETDVGLLQLGQQANISLDAYPDATFSGSISYISYASEVSNGGATVFPVKISLTDPRVYRIGLNGDVSIEVDQQKNVLLIPSDAVREESDGIYAFVKKGDKYQKTPITIGHKSDTSTVVISGVNAGDQVVTKGFSTLPK